MWGQSHIGKERRKVKLFGRVGLRLYDFWKKFSIKAIVSLATKQSSLILRNQFLLFLGDSLSHGYFSLGYYGPHYQLLNLLSPVWWIFIFIIFKFSRRHECFFYFRLTSSFCHHQSISYHILHTFASLCHFAKIFLSPRSLWPFLNYSDDLIFTRLLMDHSLVPACPLTLNLLPNFICIKAFFSDLSFSMKIIFQQTADRYFHITFFLWWCEILEGGGIFKREI